MDEGRIVRRRLVLRNDWPLGSLVDDKKRGKFGATKSRYTKTVHPADRHGTGFEQRGVVSLAGKSPPRVGGPSFESRVP